MSKQKSDRLWIISEYKHGQQSAQNGDAYINPYKAPTDSFSNYEQGYFDTKQVQNKNK